MDKRSITGLLIIGVILFGFSWYNSKNAERYSAEKEAADSAAIVENREISEPSGHSITLDEGGLPNDDSLQVQRLGVALFEAKRAPEKTYTIENDLAVYTISSWGGAIKSVRLKEYERYGGGPLELIAPGSELFDLSFFIKQGYSDALINTNDYHFTADGPSSLTVSGENGQFSMKLHVDSTSYLEYLYTIPKEDYMIGFQVNFVNMENILSNQSDMTFTWENSGPQQEKGYGNENKYTTIFYKYPGSGDIDDLGMSTGSKEEDVRNKLYWIAFKQQFFSSIFIADNDFLNARMNFDTYPEGSGLIKRYHAEIGVPFSKRETSYSFRFYYGPNKFSTLKQYEIDAQRLVPLGWSLVRWVNRLIVIPVFDFLGKYIGSFGLIILLLTIFIKILLLPFTYKSYLSMAKMRLLRPEIDEISQRYPKPEEAMKKQQATMELYKKAGVSPLGGCLPLLLQFPILVALFYFFPSSIELRGESFLWAEDLSSYDSILNLPFKIPFYGDHVSLFTLLMAVSVHITSRINLTQQPANPQMGGMKFLSLWLMPVMLLLWFNDYASGLSWYYLLSNLITMGQTYGMRYIVNDQKLHARMKENAKKPKKKSKFQARYEEMVKAQQQQQRGQTPKKKK